MTYSVHIKIADRGWILETCAREIAERSDKVSYGTDADPSADIQYYMNYSCYRERVSPVEIAFFTHIEEAKGAEEARDKFFDIAGKMDYCTTMAARYDEVLREHGIDNVAVIPPGVDTKSFQPKVKIGVVGRTYHTGRKGESLVAQVMDVAGIDWRFTGEGWPGKALHIEQGKMPEFYNDLDYVLVPALYEGGPMSVIEGLSCGVPIIASDVGWVNEYPHIAFENGNAESLRKVLKKLVKKKQTLRKTVEHVTWENWAKTHIELFDRIAAENNLTGKNRNTKALKGNDTVPETGRNNIVIVSHGSEKTAKGGPTTRIANIEKASLGGPLNVTSEFGAKDALGGPVAPDLAHVFNSWPLKSSINTIETLKASKVPVVYSPIALNLKDLSYYSNALPQILEQANSEEILRNAARKIMEKTPAWDRRNPVVPVEGPDNHFRSIIESVSSADHVIYLSEYEKAFVESLGAKPKSDTIVRNGVDAETMAAGDPLKFENRYGVKDFILMVGRIESRKNQALVAAALRNIDKPLVCIGHIGDQKYFNLLKRWAGPNFIHIDRINDREMLASAYKAASVYILASWCEGAPLSALEAAAAGTPLLLSTMSSEPDYFEAYAQYVHPCDMDKISDVVTELYENPESQEQRDLRSIMATQNFDIKVHAEKTCRVYEQVLESLKGAEDKEETANLIIDATHLAHQMANRGILTGVTSVEFNILKHIYDKEDVPDLIVWNSAHNQYFRTNLETITDQKTAKVANQRVALGDKTLVVRKIKQSVEIIPRILGDAGGTDNTAAVQPAATPKSLKRRSITAFKKTVNAMPFGLNRAITKTIQIVRPVYSPETEPPADELPITSPGSIPYINASDGTVKMHLDYTEVETSVTTPFTPGSRLVLLGQPWISNDKQLGALEALVKSYNFKFSVLLNDILYVTDPDSFSPETCRVYKNRLLRLLKFTDTVIVTSAMVEAQLKSFMQSHRVKAKTLRFNMGSFNEKDKEQAIKPKATFSKRYIMYVSSMNNRKRHDFITEVWKDIHAEFSTHHKNEDIELLFIGSGQKDYERYNDKKFRKDLESHNIRVFDHVTNQELAWLYENAMYTVYPSRSEGWGLPPIESIVHGRPCLVSDTLPVAVETDCAALVKLPPLDFYAWRNTMKSMIESDGMREGLASLAERFEANSWADAADIIENDGR